MQKKTFRTLIIIALLVMPIVTSAQIGIGLAAGAHYAKENTSPMSKMSLSGQAGPIMIEAAAYVSLTRNINPGTMLGATVGYDINGLIPVAGYWYNLKSNDRKELNEWVYGGGLRWNKLIGPNGAGISAEVLYLSNNNIAASFGITYQF